jgi:3-phosphoshikimate 1-carboxyvinyltransferase
MTKAVPLPLVSEPVHRGLAGEIRVPGDKSISHRALMLAALAIGATRISGLLEGEDVLRTAAAMRALGASLRRTGEGCWEVEGVGVGGLREPADVLDMGNSGTAARLLAGLLASHPLFAVLTGDASLRKRPMGRVIAPLSATGARFAARAGGYLPLAIEGVRDPLPLTYRLPVASAQVKSAVLLAGLNARGETVVEEPVASRDHTENMLRHFGAELTIEEAEGGGRRITLLGGPLLRGADVQVPGDPSSAAFPVVAALIVPDSQIRVKGVGVNPLRSGFLTTLREMGAAISLEALREEGGEPVADLLVRHSSLHGVDVPPERAPSMIDEYPVMAVAAAFASGTSRFRGLAELRVKESDRLTATCALLRENGVKAEITGDDLIIEGVGGPPPGGGRVVTEMDHRIAMSALVLGAGGRAAVAIDDGSFIATSFPGFTELMNGLGLAIRPLAP